MNLRKTAATAGLASALLLGGTVAAMAVSAYATSAVNVRSGPGTGYKVVDQLYDGEDVDVGSCTAGWCRVSHSGPDGWVSASYLSRNGGNDAYDDDDDVDVDIYYGRPSYPRYYPRYSHYPRYNSYPRYHSNSVCLGGPNARFCFSD